MDVDQVAQNRRKTALPRDIRAPADSPRRPNIIGNAEPPAERMVVTSQRVEKISMREIEEHASSKTELYNLLTVQGQLYLPTIKSCPLSFVKEILSGKKKVFQNHEIVPVNAPRYKELTVAKIYGMAAQVPTVLNYLPSEIEGDKLPREFLFNVVNTVVPAFFAKVIPDAEDKRQRPAKEEELITLDPKMLQLIKAFRATRHGRKKGGLHLLKTGARKRRRADFEAARHELSTTIVDAVRQNAEADVFKRVQMHQQMRRPNFNL